MWDINIILIVLYWDIDKMSGQTLVQEGRDAPVSIARYIFCVNTIVLLSIFIVSFLFPLFVTKMLFALFLWEFGVGGWNRKLKNGRNTSRPNWLSEINNK